MVLYNQLWFSKNMPLARENEMSTSEADQIIRFVRDALERGFEHAKRNLIERELIELQTRVFSRMEQELRRAQP
jgi:hypothetical protein